MNQPESTGATLRALRILYFALMAGVLLFMAIVFIMPVLDPGGVKYLQPYSQIALYVAAGLAIISYMTARYLFSKKMDAIRNTSVNVQEKLNLYRAAFISYMAFCEFPALLAIILYIISGNYGLLVVAGLMLLAMAIRFPSRQRLITDMSLDWKEQEELK